MFRNFTHQAKIAEGGAALRRVHAKRAERIRGFCDESMTLIDYVRDVVVKGAEIQFRYESGANLELSVRIARTRTPLRMPELRQQ